jgi:hypothetical protein
VSAEHDNHDHGHGGGHEVDAIDSGHLINLLVVLTVLTLGASIAVVQMFASDRDELLAERAQEGSFQYRDYAETQKAWLETAGQSDPGKFRIPVAKAKELVAADAMRLRAAPAPAGWIHPDDVNAKPAAPAPAAPAPAEGAPAEPAPTEGAAAAPAPAEGAAAAPAPAPGR